MTIYKKQKGEVATASMTFSFCKCVHKVNC